MTLSRRINDTDAAPWVIAEIRKLEAERDAYYDMAHSMSSDLTTVGEQRDALAAHVGLTAPTLREARLCLDHARVFISTRQKMHECGREAHDECIKALDGLIGSQPTTSLARLIAEKQAERMDEMADLAEQHNEPWTVQELRDEAARFRRHAEEANS